ncbi:MAG: hypothetical protein ACYS74_13630 [Planctomycetota bacterium]
MAKLSIVVTTYFCAENYSEQGTKPLLEKTVYPSGFKLMFLFLEIAVLEAENHEKFWPIWRRSITGGPDWIRQAKAPS